MGLPKDLVQADNYKRAQPTAEIKVPKLDFDHFTLVDSYTGESVEYSLKDLLKINKDNYQEAFLSQSQKYVYWNSVLQTLKAVQEGQDRKVELAHANSYNQAYNYLKTEAKVARPTKDMIESLINRDKNYQDEIKKAVEIDEQVGIIHALVKAFEQRKDMLISFGADIRNQKDNYVNN